MTNVEKTVSASSLLSVKWLEDPYKYNIYDGVQAQMDRGAKYTVTNKLELFHDIWFYSKLFPTKVKMKGAASKNVIIPVSEEFLEITTITEGIFMKVKY